MSRLIPPASSLALMYLRSLRGMSQKDLARALGLMDVSLLSRYETGKKAFTREKLEEMLVPLDVPSEAVDLLLFVHEMIEPRAEPSPSPVALEPRELRRIGRTVLAGMWTLGERLSGELIRGKKARKAAAARRRAEELWVRLKAVPPAERRRAAASPEYRSWALVEKVCRESVRRAAHKASEALELADLARFLAERAAGGEGWRSRLQGYAWAHIANARRVANDVAGAGEAFVRAWDFWRAGADSDPDLLLAEWRLYDLEASLRREERRFSEALQLLDRALKASGGGGEQAGRILLNKAFTLEQMGDFEGSIKALEEAAPLIKDGRLLFGVRFNTAANLCHLECCAEAAAILPEVRELAVQQANELDLIRVLWLEARVMAGQGRVREALESLEQVRRELTARALPYDAALSSLDQAVLWLEQGNSAKVRALAEEMIWIFRSNRIHREALAALQLFYDTARQEAATAALVRQVIADIERVRRSAPPCERRGAG